MGRQSKLEKALTEEAISSASYYERMKEHIGVQEEMSSRRLELSEEHQKMHEKYQKQKTNLMIADAATNLIFSAGQLKTSVNGAYSPNSSLFGIQYPFFLVRRRSTYTDNADYEKLVGKPSYKTVKLSNISGYVKVGRVHVEDITDANNPPTLTELDEIEELLLSGVIL